jgi:hypothetical protein
LRLTTFDTTAVIGQDLDFETIEPLSPTEVAGTLSTSVEREELIQPMVAIEVLCNPIPELPYLIMPKSHIQPPP